jgi:hypothetical protein
VKQCANLNQPLAGAGSHGLTDGTPRHSSSNDSESFGVSVFVIFAGQTSSLSGIGLFTMAYPCSSYRTQPSTNVLQS